MQIQYKLTFQDFYAAQALHARRGVIPFLGRWFAFYGLMFIGVAGGLFFLALAIVQGPAHFDRTPFFLSLVWIGLPLYVRWAYRRQFHRSQSESGQNLLDLDADSIRCKNEHSKSEMEWAAIQRTAEDKKSLLLYLAPGKFLVVPKRVCSAEQIDELRALLQRNVVSLRKK